LKQTGEPVVLTINGKAELVVQDAAAYQKLRQIAEEARVLEGIRQGIEDMNAGRTVSLDEFKKHARTKHGIRTLRIAPASPLGPWPMLTGRMPGSPMEARAAHASLDLMFRRLFVLGGSLEDSGWHPRPMPRRRVVPQPSIDGLEYRL